MREDKQLICDFICQAIRCTDAGGKGNALAHLQYIAEGETEIVRPIFTDGTGSNGYYDINVTWDSGIAVIIDVVEKFVRKMW